MKIQFQMDFSWAVHKVCNRVLNGSRYELWLTHFCNCLASCNRKENVWTETNPSFIYSWSISCIWEHQFYYLGCLGSQWVSETVFNKVFCFWLDFLNIFIGKTNPKLEFLSFVGTKKLITIHKSAKNINYSINEYFFGSK